MTDITPEYEAKMRVACHSMVAAALGDPLESFVSRVAVRQYLDIVQPELVLALLDMGIQMTEAVEKIDKLVTDAGFDNLEQALKAIERIGKLLHNAD